MEQLSSQPTGLTTPSPSPIPTPTPPPKRRCVMVCQHRSCVRNGSDAVLAALRAAAPGVLVSGTDCMGQCSSGPTVKVTPDNVWYCHVTVADVEAIATQHLYGDEPVKPLLHPRFHPPETMFTEP